MCTFVRYCDSSALSGYRSATEVVDGRIVIMVASATACNFVAPT